MSRRTRAPRASTSRFSQPLCSLSLLAMLGLSTLAAGCAEERAPIDRVQPNALSKSMFAGEFYYGRTVVDVPSGNGFTFVGSTDFRGLQRIRWDIQENFVYARRQIELIDGADDRGLTNVEYEGEVVAAFRVLSHFDIAWQYNATTGERLNIRYENTTDRPWHQRQSLRVDWSVNLVTNYDLDFETASIEPVPFYVQALNDDGTRNPDAPVFVNDGEYFDITSRIFARAQTINIPGYGSVPLCWLQGRETTECGAGEYAIRHSFERVDPNHQYEPLPYKGAETELFGFFETSRLRYDPLQGIVEQNRERYLNRHNLWERWFNEDGTSIPYANRTLRPIVYHVNTDFPTDLKPMARSVADQWNAIFRDSVAVTGYPLGENEAVFVLCENNPVQEGDPAVCGQAGDSPRIGDIRYSFMAYIPKYMDYGLLGLGPSYTDPETGEIRAGAAYIYHHNNLAAWRTVEMLRLLNGDLDPQTFIDGVDITEWVDQVSGRSEAAPRTFGLEDAAFMARSVANGWASEYWGAERQLPSAHDLHVQEEHGFHAMIEPYLQDMYRRGMHNGERVNADARLGLLQGTEIEGLLLNPEVLLAHGHQHGTPVSSEIREAASIARGGMGRLAVEQERLRHAFAESRNMYLPEMADDALIGLARELRGRPSEDAYDVVRNAVYTAVLAHEVGHTIGLMHNFGGSDDAINYHDRYWELRDDGNIGPRLVDPMTEAERNGRIYDHAYSSIMDYAGRYTIDGQGVGKYDRAAILFGYGEHMEVFRDTGRASVTQLNQWFSTNGDILNFSIAGPNATHYTAFYERMGELLYRDDNRVPVPISAFEGRYDALDYQGQRLARVPYIYCSHNRADLSDSCLTRDAGADPMERMTNILDDLNTWYILRNFPRGRLGVDSNSYVSRTYPRVYHRLKKWHDLYGLYVTLFARFFDAQTTERFLTDPVNGWGGQTWAVQNAFNYLVQTLLMPEVGGYAGPIPQSDGSQMLMTGFTPVQIEVDITGGRYFSTSWGDGGRECGYQWYECLHHVGFYLDKIMAIEALSDSETNFVARATPIDIRQWEVSYYNTFADQIAEINRAMMAGEWDRVGPYSQNGQVRFPNYAGDLSQRNANPIDPAASFSVQLYWQVLGQARFPQNFDRSFVDDSRVFIVGTGDAPLVDPARMASLVDPNTGIVYGALRVRDRVGSGEAMINRAHNLLRWSTLCDDDETTLTVDDDCEEIPAAIGRFVTRAQATRDYRDTLQLFRVVTQVSDHMMLGDPYNP